MEIINQYRTMAVRRIHTPDVGGSIPPTGINNHKVNLLSCNPGILVSSNNSLLYDPCGVLEFTTKTNHLFSQALITPHGYLHLITENTKLKAKNRSRVILQ